jgi:hypothetical protein
VGYTDCRCTRRRSFWHRFGSERQRTKERVGER